MHFSNYNQAVNHPENGMNNLHQSAPANPLSHGGDMREGQPKAVAFGQAYVLYQSFNQVYNLQKALSAGTIFPELHIPYKTEGGGRNG